MKGWRIDQCEECGHEWWRPDYVRVPFHRCPACKSTDAAELPKT